MANSIEVTSILPTRFVSPTSRYANSKVIYYSDSKKITFGSYQKNVPALSDLDKFMVISKGVEYRPDLVSYDNYGTVDFWWRIMEFNGMKDILEFKSGVNIRLPNNVFF